LKLRSNIDKKKNFKNKTRPELLWKEQLLLFFSNFYEGLEQKGFSNKKD